MEDSEIADAYFERVNGQAEGPVTELPRARQVELHQAAVTWVAERLGVEKKRVHAAIERRTRRESGE